MMTPMITRRSAAAPTVTVVAFERAKRSSTGNGVSPIVSRAFEIDGAPPLAVSHHEVH